MLLFTLLMFVENFAFSQVAAPADSLKEDSLRIMAARQLKLRNDSMLRTQYDIGNLYNDLFRPHRKRDTVKKKSSGITVIPNVAANPSIGSQIGIKAVAGRVLGTDPTTLMSVGATSASITTKGIIYFYINHNVFTNANKWNLQGSIIAAKTVTPDFGLGIGRAANGSTEDQILSDPNRKGYVLHSQFYSLRERVYKQIEDNLFLGAGVSFDIRRKIEDRAATNNQLTPYHIYSDRYGIDPDNYMANGLLFNVEYTTRDNQNRAYKGIYADAGFRINQTWIGSTKNAVQFTVDVRKYWSLSKRNPEHVLAFWNWGSAIISGAVPYLELPGTGKDPSLRSGRGYIIGYFKAPQFYYSELEYRFPITRNKFISGVTFANVQTANDEMGTKIFRQWQPAAGGGLRVLFNKATRTNLCLDYAFGRYGSKGFFLGLNEAF
ncbi:BamA/TamA family outer membrane protein [Mucilaginibacter sp. Bleaf8]|nr:BamA/TamA family outer membrane protein [Mucilaginibacter sp. Bleaf8]MBS7566351.1 BamA/TamA family outer membrane protein [Mucilaginibacter sp. Bleaf8]